MKVYIGPYNCWFQPGRWYKDLVLWLYGFDNSGNDYDMRAYNKLIDEINDGWLYAQLDRIERWVDNRIERKINVKIHPYDVWSMDSTLAPIILPMLKLLKEQKQGSPHIDDEDVPAELRATAAPPLTPEQSDWGNTDEHFHKRWEWAIDEMIWAFSQIDNPDSDDEFHYDLDPDKPRMEAGISFKEMMKRGGFDKDGYTAWQKRKTHGLLLFGKYFEALWD